MPGEHDKPRVVLRVVGDPAAQNHQTVSGRGLGSTDGDVRGIARPRAPGASPRRCRNGGSVTRWGGSARKREHCSKPSTAARTCADRTEWDIADTAEAILDARRLLTDDRHLVFTQQIVGLVDAPGGRVLDRQNREVDISRLRARRPLPGRSVSPPARRRPHAMRDISGPRESRTSGRHARRRASPPGAGGPRGSRPAGSPIRRGDRDRCAARG